MSSWTQRRFAIFVRRWRRPIAAVTWTALAIGGVLFFFYLIWTNPR